MQAWQAQYPQTASHPEVRVEIAELPGLELLDLLSGADYALIVDAIKGNEPAGEIHILDDVLALCGSEPVVLLTNAMERRRFRGPLRRLSRGVLRALHLARGGRSVALRHPWRLREVRNACRARGLEVEVLPQDPRLSTAHHRVDLLIRRAPDAAA